MKCPKCKGTGKEYRASMPVNCPICKGLGEVERTDGIDYNRKIAVPEHKAKL